MLHEKFLVRKPLSLTKELFVLIFDFDPTRTHMCHGLPKGKNTTQNLCRAFKKGKISLFCNINLKVLRF